MITNILLFLILIFNIITSVETFTIRDKVELFEQKLKELYREEV